MSRRVMGGNLLCASPSVARRFAARFLSFAASRLAFCRFGAYGASLSVLGLHPSVTDSGYVSGSVKSD
jgi:hypothetical protein